MATQLTYPQLPKVRLGLWTLKVKIHYYTGLIFEDIKIWGSGGVMHIDFKIDLTQAQIDWITNLVARADVQGPDTDLIVPNNTYMIYDIWEHRDLIAERAGIHFRIWWDTSGIFGNDVMDKILFTLLNPDNSAKTDVTNTNKRNFIDAMISESGWL